MQVNLFFMNFRFILKKPILKQYNGRIYSINVVKHTSIHDTVNRGFYVRIITIADWYNLNIYPSL